MDRWMQAMEGLLGTGVESNHLAWMQTVTRGAVVYVAGVFLLRLASKRLLGRRTPFDLVLTIVLGSTLSRAINGSAPLLASLSAGLLLVLADRGFAALAFRWSRFRRLIEGRSSQLVEGGRPIGESLRATHISEEELRWILRRETHDSTPVRVREAWLDPDGRISIVTT